MGQVVSQVSEKDISNAALACRAYLRERLHGVDWQASKIIWASLFEIHHYVEGISVMCVLQYYANDTETVKAAAASIAMQENANYGTTQAYRGKNFWGSYTYIAIPWLLREHAELVDCQSLLPPDYSFYIEGHCLILVKKELAHS